MPRPTGNLRLEERRHDYLYDPTYTLSSARDHARARQKSLVDNTKLEKIFSFENFFSEIPIHKPFQWKKQIKDPVPDTFPKEFKPSLFCQDLLKIQLKEAGGYDMGIDVRGRQRPIYFTHRGDASFNIADDFLSTEAALIRNANQYDFYANLPAVTDELALKNKLVQTDYRESEAQTLPYSPPYVVNVGETPEALTLASLGYGKGLPAKLHDVEMIERARVRRNIENKLEPFLEIYNSPHKLARRKKILQDLELKEWHHREKEVEALQEIRLKVLVKLLRKREERIQEIKKKRLDRMLEVRSDELELKRKAVQLKYIAALRKLNRRRIASLQPSKKRDVIKDYADQSSQIFAPLTRLGMFPDRGSEKFTVKNRFLDSLEGLLNLESCFLPSILNTDIKIQPENPYTKDGYLKRKYRYLQDLARLDEYLDGKSMRKQELSRKPRFLERIEKPPPRPETPTTIAPSGDLSQDMERATITLQRLIRGRAIQTQMFEAKEKRKELIAELRSTHALLEDDQLVKLREKQAIEAAQGERAAVIHQENQVDDILARLGSANLAEMLDFLSKELDRLIEERRIHAQVMLAERQRRMREAEESGTRQREERRRREYDEIFKQLVKVHQETVDGYLASVAGVTLEKTAAHVAEAEFDEIAQRLDAQVLEAEAQRDELQSDLMAAELVHGFLIPEVNKRSYQAALDARNRKRLQAAHQAIWGPAHVAAAYTPSETRQSDSMESNKDQQNGSTG